MRKILTEMNIIALSLSRDVRLMVLLTCLAQSQFYACPKPSTRLSTSYVVIFKEVDSQLKLFDSL